MFFLLIYVSDVYLFEIYQFPFIAFIRYYLSCQIKLFIFEIACEKISKLEFKKKIGSTI